MKIQVSNLCTVNEMNLVALIKYVGHGCYPSSSGQPGLSLTKMQISSNCLCWDRFDSDDIGPACQIITADFLSPLLSKKKGNQLVSFPLQITSLTFSIHQFFLGTENLYSRFLFAVLRLFSPPPPSVGSRKTSPSLLVTARVSRVKGDRRVNLQMELSEMK